MRYFLLTLSTQPAKSRQLVTNGIYWKMKITPVIPSFISLCQYNALWFVNLMAFILQCRSSFRRTLKNVQVIIPYKNCIFEILEERKTPFYSVAGNSHSQIEHSDWLIIIFLLRFLSIDWNPSSWLFWLNYIIPCHKLLSKFTSSGLC